MLTERSICDEVELSSNPFAVSASELASRIGHPGLSVVDGSWYLPAQKRFARPEYEAGHIPGAVFFDHDTVVAADSDLPHSLPDAATFGNALSELGVSDLDTIVVYDGLGLFSAPRLWWMLRTFGARDVRILDGGFPAWREGGYPIETSVAPRRRGHFDARLDIAAVASLSDVQAIVSGVDDGQIVDARLAERFRGDVPEPRAGVRSGHMPGARSLPFTDLVRDGRLMDPDAIRAAFERAGVDLDRSIVTSCGSGVTAAVVTLALARLGVSDTRLYDGSWTEWGSLADTPVETGPAT
ncbi:3-mercaptopyruvate sulfurtransferase [Aureimonas jatrophae]|uniref:Thiosulfate/3-mercaptopyruvate sulfurtransferase n=1 Tax=Aureimonas jatrophae TaxID=1166073 RepID=A0A1H0GV07_9HYPH|nr:3-mercaptopyruvate sulfurtransferase [Aureimonas jatrophae]MBB3949805.1 thiosulfate/3-mercaptopyruvate sulfurtransferase [Aureimonas jatrophae]SDO10730.1 thiosulfate/3-mercaptopyruvate sulfurtransferase [Aureimonas jatrophae]